MEGGALGDGADARDADRVRSGPRQARRCRKPGGRRFQYPVKADEDEGRRWRETAAAAGLTVPHLLMSTTLACLDGQRPVSVVERRTLAWEIETLLTSLGHEPPQ
ncbi:hypothetical protein [Actinomadura coerulea]|uniref:hypothetical protein n=1 Tax=Actinomadura coerulea TaxID=46159 RepID=UPI0034268787